MFNTYVHPNKNNLCICLCAWYVSLKQMILLKYVKRKIRKIVNGFTECQNWNKFILRESFVAFLLVWYSLLCLTKHILFLTKYKSQQQLKTKSYSWISTWDVLPFKILISCHKSKVIIHTKWNYNYIFT